MLTYRTWNWENLRELDFSSTFAIFLLALFTKGRGSFSLPWATIKNSYTTLAKCSCYLGLGFHWVVGIINSRRFTNIENRNIATWVNNGSTCLLEVDQATRSTYLLDYISSMHYCMQQCPYVCHSCPHIQMRMNSLKPLHLLPSYLPVTCKWKEFEPMTR